MSFMEDVMVLVVDMIGDNIEALELREYQEGGLRVTIRAQRSVENWAYILSKACLALTEAGYLCSFAESIQPNHYHTYLVVRPKP